MGIDCYLLWSGQTAEEADGQVTGFATNAGRVGYLREAYHGGPYATRVLFPPRYWEPEDVVDLGPNPRHPEDRLTGVKADVAELRERLPAAVMAATYRSYAVYGEGQSPGEIVDEDFGRGGALMKALKNVFENEVGGRADEAEALMKAMTPKQIEGAKRAIAEGAVDYPAKSFIEFVQLAETKAAEGREVAVYISY